MSEIAGILNSLEKRINTLLNRIGELEKTVAAHREESDRNRMEAHSQAAEIDRLKAETQSLRMANALLGSEDNKRETKLKINSLIREIDQCIAQLAD